MRLKAKLRNCWYDIWCSLFLFGAQTFYNIVVKSTFYLKLGKDLFVFSFFQVGINVIWLHDLNAHFEVPIKDFSH